MANMESFLSNDNSMGNTTRFVRKLFCKPRIRDMFDGENMLHLTSTEYMDYCDDKP